MKIEYDEEVDAVYIYLKKIEKDEIKRTIELDDNIILDFDEDKKLMGIEILNASKVIPKQAVSDLIRAASG